MNKEKQALLNKCVKLPFNEKMPIFGGIYIIPTQYKHDSGYKIMYIVGHTPWEFKKTPTYYLIDTCCDVVDFGQILNLSPTIEDLHIDITTGGVIHVWSNSQNMKAIFKCSSCSFEMVSKREGIKE